ncbi:MAG: sigma-54 dependent transcriptional regulator [Paracoccaceae bacterium]|nr:sigma-54 dependent transcriptional regulator [Paracoccaceae bacterium]MDG1369527.1 sigma-54 dependent transcriptional regulator [Paracoccaceae bacterium]
MRPAADVLLVEDTPSLSLVYETVLKKAGYPVTTAFTAAEAMTAHQGADGKVVLLDLMLPDGDGLDVLKEMTLADPAGKRIVITANGSINRAVEAMRGGAFDFLVKPFDERRLIAAVNNARAAIQIETTAPRAEVAAPTTSDAYHGFIGGSDPMRRIYGMIEGIGKSTATVFITGESGTGKEVAAQALHAVSSRAAGPFVPLNCGAIPKDLLESEVFGHLRGSFTGALADKPGAAAVADGGTLFLDEICEMDMALQTKLLRFLQTSMITPVGATTPRKVEVRIVCATNRDPTDEVRADRFREDLFYRLHVVPIHLPPLRERGDDVVQIAEKFLVRFSKEEGKAFKRLGAEATELFRSMRWPGNVRQLQNVIRNIVVLNDGEEVGPHMLPQGLRESEAIAAPPRVYENATAPVTLNGAMNGHAGETSNGHLNGQASLATRVAPLVGETLADVEQTFIEATIDEFEGSIPRAARALDLSPSTLYRKREAWSKKEA